MKSKGSACSGWLGRCLLWGPISARAGHVGSEAEGAARSRCPAGRAVWPWRVSREGRGKSLPIWKMLPRLLSLWISDGGRVEAGWARLPPTPRLRRKWGVVGSHDLTAHTWPGLRRAYCWPARPGLPREQPLPLSSGLRAAVPCFLCDVRT